MTANKNKLPIRIGVSALLGCMQVIHTHTWPLASLSDERGNLHDIWGAGEPKVHVSPLFISVDHEQMKPLDV